MQKPRTEYFPVLPDLMSVIIYVTPPVMHDTVADSNGSRAPEVLRKAEMSLQTYINKT